MYIYDLIYTAYTIKQTLKHMKYFTVNELCKSNSHPKLVEIPKVGSNIYNNIITLIDTVLDPLREAIGKPITISSGYRSEKLNNAVNGSKTSAHLYGLAADMHTGNNSSDNLKLVSTIIYRQLPFDQIIIEFPIFNNNNEIVSAKWIHVGLSNNKNRKQILCYHNNKYITVNIQSNFSFKI